MLLNLQKVCFRYDSGFRLRDIDLRLQKGAFFALLGPNGSGKSTLVKIISALTKAESGEIQFDGRPLTAYGSRQLARKLAVIPSENHFEFPFRVSQVAAMGRFPFLGRLQRMSEEDRQIVDRALRLTRADELRERPISELSSGERQRVLMARALAQQPKLLVLDEPNAHLDIHHQIAIFRLLRRLNREEGLTVLAVLHDLTMASVFCKTVAIMEDGAIVRQGAPGEVITADNIRAIYGADVLVHSNRQGVPMITYAAEEQDAALPRAKPSC